MNDRLAIAQLFCWMLKLGYATGTLFIQQPVQPASEEVIAARGASQLVVDKGGLKQLKIGTAVVGSRMVWGYWRVDQFSIIDGRSVGDYFNSGHWFGGENKPVVSVSESRPDGAVQTTQHFKDATADFVFTWEGENDLKIKVTIHNHAATAIRSWGTSPIAFTTGPVSKSLTAERGANQFFPDYWLPTGAQFIVGQKLSIGSWVEPYYSDKHCVAWGKTADGVALYVASRHEIPAKSSRSIVWRIRFGVGKDWKELMGPFKAMARPQKYAGDKRAIAKSISSDRAWVSAANPLGLKPHHNGSLESAVLESLSYVPLYKDAGCQGLIEWQGYGFAAGESIFPTDVLNRSCEELFALKMVRASLLRNGLAHGYCTQAGRYIEARRDGSSVEPWYTLDDSALSVDLLTRRLKRYGGALVYFDDFGLRPADHKLLEKVRAGWGDSGTWLIEFASDWTMPDSGAFLFASWNGDKLSSPSNRYGFSVSEWWQWLYPQSVLAVQDCNNVARIQEAKSRGLVPIVSDYVFGDTNVRAALRP